MFYLVQRMDTDSFSPACFIDPEYCREFMDAVSKGVEVIVYDVSIDRYGVSLNKELDFF
jgi:DNA-binding sugar fermentation-stimulating protein